MGTHLAAKIAALSEIYPTKNRTQIVADLLTAALDDLEKNLPMNIVPIDELQQQLEDENSYRLRDSSSRETLRRSLVQRFNNSKNMVLILTSSTKNDIDWVPFEILHAIDNCDIPIIAAYPDYSSILSPHLLSDYWPQVLASRISNGKGRVIHIPFKKEAIADAIDQFHLNNKNYPKDGLGFYNKETHISWGLISP